MSEMVCSRCGAKNPEASAFCNRCGTPFAASASAGPTAPPAPPSQGYSSPPGAYPVHSGAARVVGTNTKWALGLAGAGLVLGWTFSFLAFIAPVLAVAGAYAAKRDIDEFTAGNTPQVNADWARGAYYANIAVAVLVLLALFMMLSRGCAAA
jgi:hypothetical protein